MPGDGPGTARQLQNRVLDRMVERIELLNDIGITLSSEHAPMALLERILLGAMRLTGADGGTVYLLDDERRELRFGIMRTESLGIALGGRDQRAVELPAVPLHLADGRPNRASVVACAVLEERTVNLADAYQEPGFDFSGTRAFDERTGYRSRSMLTIPMRNHEREIIGVLQLLNARRGDGPDPEEVVPFTEFDQRLAESLASQAAITLTRHRLMSDMEALFEAFVRLIAEAIDRKSPHTGNHCRRVPEIAMLLADACCRTEHGPLADFDMTPAERYELQIAALLHDCGKIATPEWVMDKATKLQGISDRMIEIGLRYELLRRDAEYAYLKAIHEGGDPERAAEHRERVLAQLAEEEAFLGRCNRGTETMEVDDQERVREIGRRTWRAADGSQRPLLTEDEVENLTIARGTLNAHERRIIENHIVSTIDMLESLPYPKHLRRVPEVAGGHHERMDGRGYPRGLTREEMSWEARMMGLADVFEALTAKDRPYKEPMSMSQALTILGRMAEEGHIDPDLYRTFVAEGVWREYGEQHMDPRQLDAVDIASLPGMRSGT